MNQICLSTTFTADQSPLKQALEICEQAMITTVEVGSNHCYENDYSYVKDYSFEYLVHNYFPVPKESFVVNLSSLDEIIHKKSIKHIKSSIRFCAEIGAKLYTFHPGFLTDPKGSNQSSKNYDFQWDTKRLLKINYERAWEKMIFALDEIIPYAKEKQVAIAIETEGSVHKKDHLMMQHLAEYERFLNKFTVNEIGINLNIGHLMLATNAFDFSYQTFVDQIADSVVAMELSHNDGIEDQHLPLQPDGWYWPLINDKRFEQIYKILEFRNTNIEKIQDVIRIYKEKQNES
jgi:sugar phosphate isomerase/epimerase